MGRIQNNEEILMKKIVLLLGLVSLSSFANTIKHENCRLNGGFRNIELNMILEGKGYILYSGKIEANTLDLETETTDEGTYLFSGALRPMLCPGDRFVKWTGVARISRFDGKDYFTQAQTESSYFACLQSGGVRKDLRNAKAVLKRLPDCELR
jgi:hypothetical protein